MGDIMQLGPQEAVLMNMDPGAVNLLDTDFLTGTHSKVKHTSALHVTVGVQVESLVARMERYADDSDDPTFREKCLDMRDDAKYSTNGTKSKLYVLIDKATKRSGSIKIIIACFRAYYDTENVLVCDNIMINETVAITPDYSGFFSYLGILSVTALAGTILLPELGLAAAIAVVTGMTITDLGVPVRNFLAAVAPGTPPEEPLRILLEAQIVRNLLNRGIARREQTSVIVDFGRA
jgi:hypothetical protein